MAEIKKAWTVALHDGREMMSVYVGIVGRRGASIAALALVFALVTSSHSAAQTKEGTYKGTYTAFGKATRVPVGKDRTLVIISDEKAQTLSDGFLDHAVWQCWGIGDYTKGVGHDHGQCIATDPAGDQVVDSWVTEDHEPGSKTVKGMDQYTGGTGKYAGVSGSGQFVLEAFGRTPEGNYALHGTWEGGYKIP